VASTDLASAAGTTQTLRNRFGHHCDINEQKEGKSEISSAEGDTESASLFRPSASQTTSVEIELGNVSRRPATVRNTEGSMELQPPRANTR
jgi:hypothetical protein